MKIGVYIHIPFCKQKCLYCDFISYAGKENLQNQYVEAVKKEIINWKEHNQDKEIETIYIGGGTPSYIESKAIAEILSLVLKNQSNIAEAMVEVNQSQIAMEAIEVNKSNIAETTIEVNPGTVTEQKLIDYKNAGINRLSVGLQSTNNNTLKMLGRIHEYQDFLNTYELARKVGFKNINVDLMIGLPKQNMQNVKDDLETIINLDAGEPEHISVYSLIVEQDTQMKKLIDEGVLKLPEDEEERQMYWYVKHFLEQHGYNHYEISNFAKTGFESKHNLDCWNQKEYVGFGVAAHSYLNDKRFHNIVDLEKYIENIEHGDFEKNIIVDEIQNKIDKMKEYMLIGLRKIEGISIKQFEDNFKEDPTNFFKGELHKLSEEELITIDKDRIKLSNKGLDLANLVWEEFI